MNAYGGFASAQRRFDRAQERWIDGETNWYTVVSFRQLALNCSTSVEKGQRVVVTGRLRIREWDNGERIGTTIEIEADSVGHDLLWGTSIFSRSVVSRARPDDSEAAMPVATSAPELSPPESSAPESSAPETAPESSAPAPF